MGYPQFEDISKVAVVGAGSIGASWAAFYLARGFRVAVTDPRSSRSGCVTEFGTRAWPAIVRLAVPAVL